MQKQLIFSLLFIFSFTTSLSAQKYWDGPSSPNEREADALTLCKCMHKMLLKNDVDITPLYPNKSTFLADRESLSFEAFDQKYEWTKPLLRKAESVSEDLDDEKCAKEMDTKYVLLAPEEKDKVTDALQQHCIPLKIFGKFM